MHGMDSVHVRSSVWNIHIACCYLPVCYWYSIGTFNKNSRVSSGTVINPLFHWRGVSLHSVPDVPGYNLQSSTYIKALMKPWRHFWLKIEIRTSEFDKKYIKCEQCLVTAWFLGKFEISLSLWIFSNVSYCFNGFWCCGSVLFNSLLWICLSSILSYTMLIYFWMSSICKISSEEIPFSAFSFREGYICQNQDPVSIIRMVFSQGNINKFFLWSVVDLMNPVHTMIFSLLAKALLLEKRFARWC